jgi:hypothetical protein
MQLKQTSIDILLNFAAGGKKMGLEITYVLTGNAIIYKKLPKNSQLRNMLAYYDKEQNLLDNDKKADGILKIQETDKAVFRAFENMVKIQIGIIKNGDFKGKYHYPTSINVCQDKYIPDIWNIAITEKDVISLFSFKNKYYQNLFIKPYQDKAHKIYCIESGHPDSITSSTKTDTTTEYTMPYGVFVSSFQSSIQKLVSANKSTVLTDITLDLLTYMPCKKKQ